MSNRTNPEQAPDMAEPSEAEIRAVARAICRTDEHVNPDAPCFDYDTPASDGHLQGKPLWMWFEPEAIRAIRAYEEVRRG